jgi:hypothetical protein
MLIFIVVGGWDTGLCFPPEEVSEKAQGIASNALKGSPQWKMKSTSLKWKRSLESVLRADTRMVFTLALRKRATPPNGFLSAQAATRFLT